MKKLIPVVVAIAFGIFLWRAVSPHAPRTIQPLYGASYIAVYGRDCCGYTQDFLRDLALRGLHYTYKQVDDPGVRDELLPRMSKSGLDTSEYLLPVVDVNGKIMIRPETDQVAALYAVPSPKKTPSAGRKAAPSPQDLLQISGVMMAEEPYAIVGGSVVKTGDQIGDYEVLEIQENSVKFRDSRGKTLVREAN